jgi:hypothetical protein
MNIEFVWSGPTTTITRDLLESKVRDDLQDDPDTKPCHRGKISVQLSCADPLESKVTGKLICKCGKAFAELSRSSAGSTLIYRER